MKKSNSIKVFAFLVAIAMMLTLLAACNGDDETPTPATGDPTGDPTATGDPHETLENPNISIVYWQSLNAYTNATSLNENVYDPILDPIPDFEEKYGGTITLHAVNWGDMLSTMTQMQNAGEAPDMVMVYDRTMHPVILNNFVMDISDYVTDADYSFWEVGRDLFMWEDGTYAIPIKPYLFYVMFNRDMFEMEGLQTPDELFLAGEWTYEKFDEVGRALTKRVDGEMTQYAFTSWSDFATDVIVTNGGRMVDVDSRAGTARSGLSDTNTQTSLEWLQRWVDNTTGIINIGYNDFGGFDNNMVAMIRGKEFPVELPFEVGMVPYPSGPDVEPRTIYIYPQAMAVPEGSSNPAGTAAFLYTVNQKQVAEGNAKEAARIGQDNYDMIYSDQSHFVYAYDKAVDEFDEIQASMINYLAEGVPPATVAETLEAPLNAAIEKLYG